MQVLETLWASLVINRFVSSSAQCCINEKIVIFAPDKFGFLQEGILGLGLVSVYVTDITWKAGSRIFYTANLREPFTEIRDPLVITSLVLITVPSYLS